MDYHAEVEIHEGDDGGIVLDIHAKKNRVGETEDLKPMDRRKRAIMRLEERRQARLRDSGVIGVATSRKIEPDYRISVRRVNFRWQRGLKIGEGQYGKVYSAVNMDNGELMAMKEMKFQANDHQALKELADEIILFEGMQHTTWSGIMELKSTGMKCWCLWSTVIVELWRRRLRWVYPNTTFECTRGRFYWPSIIYTNIISCTVILKVPIYF